MKYEINALKQLKDNSPWYMMLGVGLILFGILAIVYAYFSTIISVVYLGIGVVALGVFELLKSFKMNRWNNFLLHLFLSIVYLVVGIFIISNPAANAITLTLLFSIFLIIAGLARIIFALSQEIPHKNWILFNGAITLLLGILVLMQWPYSGLWVLGMFIGLDMIFTGITWVQLSLIAKNL
jgi:uncharacterized membrane protein HdeD (DUF308 family)